VRYFSTRDMFIALSVCVGYFVGYILFAKEIPALGHSIKAILYVFLGYFITVYFRRRI
jgi:hypothetical protein